MLVWCSFLPLVVVFCGQRTSFLANLHYEWDLKRFWWHSLLLCFFSYNWTYICLVNLCTDLLLKMTYWQDLSFWLAVPPHLNFVKIGWKSWLLESQSGQGPMTLLKSSCGTMSPFLTGPLGIWSFNCQKKVCKLRSERPKIESSEWCQKLLTLKGVSLCQPSITFCVLLMHLVDQLQLQFFERKWTGYGTRRH